MRPHCLRSALVALAALIPAAGSQAGDSGQHRNVRPDIEAWIESLTDEQGIPCCATADGGVPDAWEMGPRRYRVKIHGVWLDRLGHAIVWIDSDGETMGIRSFLPGPLT